MWSQTLLRYSISMTAPVAPFSKHRETIAEGL